VIIQEHGPMALLTLKFVDYFCRKYRDNKLPPKYRLQAELAELKGKDEYKWLKEVNSQSLQISIQ
jgi:hypothetical protein